MKKFILAMAVISVGNFVFIIGLRAEGIKEGQWSMTMVTKMEGMSQQSADMAKEMENMSPEEKAMMQQMMGKMMHIQMNGDQGMSITVNQCISNQNPVPEADKGEGCQETHTMDGNTVNFEVICKDSKSTGQVTYQENSMNGLIKSQQMVDGQETTATIEISGQYSGPCS